MYESNLHNQNILIQKSLSLSLSLSLSFPLSSILLQLHLLFSAVVKPLQAQNLSRYQSQDPWLQQHLKTLLSPHILLI